MSFLFLITQLSSKVFNYILFLTQIRLLTSFSHHYNPMSKPGYQRTPAVPKSSSTGSPRKTQGHLNILSLYAHGHQLQVGFPYCRGNGVYFPILFFLLHRPPYRTTLAPLWTFRNHFLSSLGRREERLCLPVACICVHIFCVSFVCMDELSTSLPEPPLNLFLHISPARSIAAALACLIWLE